MRWPAWARLLEPARAAREQGLLDTRENCSLVRIRRQLRQQTVWILFIHISSVKTVVEIVIQCLENACVNVGMHEHHYLINVPLNLAQLAISLSLTSLLTAETRNVHLLWLCRAYGNGQNLSGILELFHTFSRIAKSVLLFEEYLLPDKHPIIFFTWINEDNKPD